MDSMFKLMAGLALVTSLSACGGSSSGSNDDAYAGTGQLTLSITDAPVDGAKEVWITIDGVHLKRSGGTEKDVILSGPDIDPIEIGRASCRERV